MVSGWRERAWIVPVGTGGFADGYHRAGVLLHAVRSRFDFQAEQWWGRDADADGFGTIVGSSGGYARLKYYPNPHAYLAIRYDAFAVPFISRDIVYYGAFLVTPHVRLIVQQVQTIPGPGHLGAALTVGAPWPSKL